MRYVYILEQISKDFDGDKYDIAGVTEDIDIAIKWRESSSRFFNRSMRSQLLVTDFKTIERFQM